MSEDISWGDVGTATARPLRYFAEVSLDKFWGAFRKGSKGPQPYDPNLDKRKAIAVNINLYPVFEMGNVQAATYSFMAESPEFQLFRDSLFAAMGLPEKPTKEQAEAALSINKWFAAIEWADSKGTYKAQDENGVEVLRHSRGLKVLALFKSDVDCGNACAVYQASEGANPETVAKIDPQRETALKFLKAIVDADMEARPQFSSNPVLSCLKWEDADVQEIVQK